MKIIKVMVLFVMMSLSATQVLAVEVPKPFIDGLKAYQTEGFDKAFSIWIKGSPMENDTTSLMSIRGGFTQVETAYGKMIGYELTKIYQVSDSTIRVYGVIKYEKGPVFCVADYYKSKNGWILPLINFHTKVHEIFPHELIHKE